MRPHDIALAILLITPCLSNYYHVSSEKNDHRISNNFNTLETKQGRE